jgi:ATP-dependent Lhr-like helicase
LIEYVSRGPGSSPGNQIIIHTFWGARVNRPFALALQASLEKKYGHHLEIFVDNNCIIILLSHPIAAKELFSLVTPDNLIKYLKQSLEKTGFFGARFRENAGRALLINKRSFNERLPLWMIRLRSKKLLSAVVNLKDFPILLETWRTCLQDEFDLESLKLVLEEISNGTIKVTECFTLSPSPMAGSVSWQQISQYMYADDSFPLKKTSQLSHDLFHDAVFDKGLRPAVPQYIVTLFEKKRQRLFPGYAPSPGLELVEWVKERQIIPQPEWNELIADVISTYSISQQDLHDSLGDNLIQISTDSTPVPWIMARENHERILQVLLGGSGLHIKKQSIDQGRTFSESALSVSEEAREKGLYLFLKDWLMFYGPKQLSWIEKILGIESSHLYRSMIDLLESESIISGYLIEGENQETICDAENFEILLRIKRAETKPVDEPRNITELPLFLAVLSELSGSENNIQSLYRILERFIGFTLPVSSWESDIFPSRIQGYKTQWLDTLIRDTNLRWTGQAKQQIKFFFSDELNLIQNKNGKNASMPEDILPDPSAKYDFETLAAKTRIDPKELTDHLWNNVWNGYMSNDTFSALRKGILHHFRYPENLSSPDTVSSRSARSRRHLSLSHWKETRISPGNWFFLPNESFESDTDLIEKEERNKDRVRILLDRYGLVFRELLHKEFYPFRWQDLFRSLRLMELSGEVLSGYFFTGIPGPQFISPEALRLFRSVLPKDHIFWISAVDPVSLCGLPLDPMREYMPRRLDGTYLVYHGTKLIIIMKKKGRDLTIDIPPHELKDDRYFNVFKHLLTREFQPMRRVIIDFINQKPAPISPYISIFKNYFDVTVDVKNVSLYKRI